MKANASNLETGSKVAIIGGGPAGSLFALYLLHFAGERGIAPDITIYQQRDFYDLGPKGCKGCAGILSLSLLRNLNELGLTLPEEIIQSKIDHYAVHSPYTSISISSPEKGIRIVSIYRGGGPRVSNYKNRISFDGWLLRQAEGRGVKVEHEVVSRLHLGKQAKKIEVAGKELEFDLLVLATGANAKPIQITGFNYLPPKTITMVQDELYVGANRVESRLGNMAHAFLIPRSRLIFGTLVPKGPFINVSVLSSGEPLSVREFLNYDIVRNVLPDRYEYACGCRPRALIGSAGNYYTDGFVAIGDAVVTRLYKDGVGSSLLTAREAARTTVYHGITRQHFERYYQPLCNEIKCDNRWGKLLFSINNRVKDSPIFLLAQHRLIGDEQSNATGLQPFTRAAWGMFTGSYSYTAITRMALRPSSIVKGAAALFLESLTRLFSKGTTHPKRIHVGVRKVLILGSGFGGTYVLRHLVPALNKNENVETTLVSDENFFLFLPLLHEVAMGTIETRHVAYPIRRLHWRDRFNFIQASVGKIELGAHRVITTAGVLEYNYLVLALGSISKLPQTSEESKRTMFTLKTMYDAMLIRNQIISVFEQASSETDPQRIKQLLTFVVAGAGYTGVQVTTELRDFIHKTLLRFYKKIDKANIRIILVEAAPKIVAGMDYKLGAYAFECLQKMKIELRLKSKVTRISDGKVEINGAEIVPTSTLIWVAGISANPRIAELDAARDRIGRIVVNDYMEVPNFPGVYAVGDCAHFRDTKSGRAVPPRAHNAVRQAKVAAYNILAELRGRDKRSYSYSDPGELVSLGTAKAMIRLGGLKMYGFPARLVMTVVYSLLITGFYNRVRIVIDWMLSMTLGRDTTLIKLKDGLSAPPKDGK